MIKYRKILRLSNLGLSQHNIADNCGVSKKTVNRVLKKTRKLDRSCCMMQWIPKRCLQKDYLHLQINQWNPTNECLTLRTYARNCSVTESAKSCY